MVIFLIVIHWQCGSLLVFFNYYYHYCLIYFLLSCTLPSLLFQFFYIHKSPLCHILLLSSSSLNFLLLTNFLFSYSFPSCQCPLFSLFTEYPISLSVLTLLSEVPVTLFPYTLPVYRFSCCHKNTKFLSFFYFFLFHPSLCAFPETIFLLFIQNSIKISLVYSFLFPLQKTQPFSHPLSLTGHSKVPHHLLSHRGFLGALNHLQSLCDAMCSGQRIPSHISVRSCPGAALEPGQEMDMVGASGDGGGGSGKGNMYYTPFHQL